MVMAAGVVGEQMSLLGHRVCGRPSAMRSLLPFSRYKEAIKETAEILETSPDSMTARKTRVS